MQKYGGCGQSQPEVGFDLSRNLSCLFYVLQKLFFSKLLETSGSILRPIKY